MSLLSASKPSRTSWAGTDAIDREFHNVREPLVSIYLDGINIFLALTRIFSGSRD